VSAPWVGLVVWGCVTAAVGLIIIMLVTLAGEVW